MTSGYTEIVPAPLIATEASSTNTTADVSLRSPGTHGRLGGPARDACQHGRRGKPRPRRCSLRGPHPLGWLRPRYLDHDLKPVCGIPGRDIEKSLRASLTASNKAFAHNNFHLVCRYHVLYCFPDESNGKGRAMKECLIDVLSDRDTVLRVFPITLENQDGTTKVSVSRRPRHWRCSSDCWFGYCVQNQGSRASI